MSSLERWRGLFQPGTPGVNEAFAMLERMYAEPHRHYHTLGHIEAVLDRLGPVSQSLMFAAWLHDAVYDPRRSDNEERSAALCRAMLPALGVQPVVIAEAARLILLTKAHMADDPEGKALLDADLAVLSAPEAEYDAYSEAIRREYDWVPEADYCAGRAAVLERFLGRPRIYHDAALDEAAARRNLRRELARISDTPP